VDERPAGLERWAAPVTTTDSCTVDVVDSVARLAELFASPGAGLMPAQQARELLRIERLQASRGQPVQYVVGRDGDGSLCGLVPVYPTHAPFAGDSGPAALLGGETAGNAHVAGWKRGVYVGSSGQLPNCAVATHSGLLATLVGAATRVAAGYDPDFVCFPLLDDGLRALVAPLLPAGHLVGETEDAVIDVEFSTFDGYLESLSSHRRNRIRREQRRFNDSGLRVEEVSLARMAGELAPLLQHVEAKYGNDEPVDVFATYLTTTAMAMADRYIALVAYDGTTPIAFSVTWDTGECWWVRCWGCDHERSADAAAYFHLVFYEPLRRAAAAGVPTLVLGTASLPAKQLRGARLRRLTSLAYPSEAIEGRTRA
jgi:hypothetical protein